MASSTLNTDGERLSSILQDICTQYGALVAPSTGMYRLTLTSEDKAASDWLVSECKSLGCEMEIDEMGNIFAIRAKLHRGKSPLQSHGHAASRRKALR